VTVSTLSVAAAPRDLALSDFTVVGVPMMEASDAGAPEAVPGLPGHVGGIAVPERLDPEWAKGRGFSARPGETVVLAAAPGSPTLIGLGMGKGEGLGVGVGGTAELDRERWRRGAAALVRSSGNGVPVMVLPARRLERAAEVASAVVEGATLAAYRFDPYRKPDERTGVERFLIAGGDGGEELAAGIRYGREVAAAVCFARDLVNTPPGDLTPARLAETVAEALSQCSRTRVEVWDEARIAKERLGALLGVARGSAEPPRLIWASYEPQGGSLVTPHVALVGKGITFDSGGLSLKTADGMTTMKTDMSGAAAVMATIKACAALDISARVTAIAPATENMPGGRAIKPGDVLTARNGSTIEVLNTDAEGRLILADALSLATELQPDAIIDVATLTGAAVVALGRSIGALFGTDDVLIRRLRDAATRAGEPLWQLPLPEQYADHIDSEIADMKNVGKQGEAGSIVAALLLAKFTGKIPWAHLDIAGPARATETSGYLTKGGTGFGVRTLIELLLDLQPTATLSSRH